MATVLEDPIHGLSGAGHPARARGDCAWAATFHRRRLALREEPGDLYRIARSFEELAGLAARQQQWIRAATLLGAAEGVCVGIGATLPVAIRGEYEHVVQGSRMALGEEVFAAAWAEGRAMSLEQAVAYALEEADD